MAEYYMGDEPSCKREGKMLLGPCVVWDWAGWIRAPADCVGLRFPRAHCTYYLPLAAISGFLTTLTLLLLAASVFHCPVLSAL